MPRRELHAEHGEHRVEALVRERQRLGVALDPVDLDAGLAGPLGADVQQPGDEVEPGHPRTRQRRPGSRRCRSPWRRRAPRCPARGRRCGDGRLADVRARRRRRRRRSRPTPRSPDGRPSAARSRRSWSCGPFLWWSDARCSAGVDCRGHAGSVGLPRRWRNVAAARPARRASKGRRAVRRRRRGRCARAVAAGDRTRARRPSEPASRREKDFERWPLTPSASHSVARHGDRCGSRRGCWPWTEGKAKPGHEQGFPSAPDGFEPVTFGSVVRYLQGNSA